MIDTTRIYMVLGLATMGRSMKTQDLVMKNATSSAPGTAAEKKGGWALGLALCGLLFIASAMGSSLIGCGSGSKVCCTDGSTCSCFPGLTCDSDQTALDSCPASPNCCTLDDKPDFCFCWSLSCDASVNAGVGVSSKVSGCPK
jgi:hypothetical protein